ncbi:hypothetical protein BJG93_36095 [Paraburkholderia sprentiae WSM5005]|uniref:Uncharacterized protein n=1 Tax=Paraburkholderia sprentiae WSM5005 TaxID=754502 RepID=A0A8F4QI67_9BURK|nr:hypothetical protein [Paraburkholderia sprentiae]QXE07247.1 hypothetical protein BJG93_36095 [Paraburkholderia sprentiae WSM5005]
MPIRPAASTRIAQPHDELAKLVRAQPMLIDEHHFAAIDCVAQRLAYLKRQTAREH